MMLLVNIFFQMVLKINVDHLYFSILILPGKPFLIEEIFVISAKAFINKFKNTFVIFQLLQVLYELQSVWAVGIWSLSKF